MLAWDSGTVTTGDRIDVHSHYLGGLVLEWLSASGFRPKGSGQMVPWSVEAAMEFMDRHAIATQILSVAFGFGEPTDPDVAPPPAWKINEAFADIIRDHPDRFGAFAALPFTSADASLAEIDYALDVLKLDGIVLLSNVDGRYFGEPFFDPILAELSRRRVPVFVHPTDCPHVDVLGLGRPGSVIEFPMDTARNITNAIYRGVFQRYPGLRLILAHAGGVLPTLSWRIALNAGVAGGPRDADITAEHVAEVLRNLYYETALAGSPSSLLPALQVTSSDHILFGTDYPAAPGRAITDNTANLLAFNGFDKPQRHAVDRGNAEGLFPRFAARDNR